MMRRLVSWMPENTGGSSASAARRASQRRLCGRELSVRLLVVPRDAHEELAEGAKRAVWDGPTAHVGSDFVIRRDVPGGVSGSFARTIRASYTEVSEFSEIRYEWINSI
jgi:hypothetical protein